MQIIKIFRQLMPDLCLRENYIPLHWFREQTCHPVVDQFSGKHSHLESTGSELISETDPLLPFNVQRYLIHTTNLFYKFYKQASFPYFKNFNHNSNLILILQFSS